MVDTTLTRLDAVHEEIRAMMAQGSTLLGLDFDGTLVPIAERPEQVWLDGEGRSLLEDVRDIPGVHVAVVSGRRLDDVLVRVGLDGIAYAGNHGAELRFADRQRRSLATARDRHLARLVRTALLRIVGDLPGVSVEDKGPVVALHYRQAPPRSRAALFARLGSWRRAHPPGLRERAGDEVIEFYPASIPSKPDALLMLARECGVPGPDGIVYVGDDEADEEAFRGLGPGAVTARVGPADRYTAARHRLLDVDELRLLLHRLVLSHEA